MGCWAYPTAGQKWLRTNRGLENGRPILYPPKATVSRGHSLYIRLALRRRAPSTPAGPAAHPDDASGRLGSPRPRQTDLRPGVYTNKLPATGAATTSADSDLRGRNPACGLLPARLTGQGRPGPGVMNLRSPELRMTRSHTQKFRAGRRPESAGACRLPCLAPANDLMLPFSDGYRHPL